METGEANDTNYNVDRFLNDMMPTKLSLHSPNSVYHFWVFWSEEAGQCAIQERIKTALCSVHAVAFGFDNVLLQFWAPTVVGSGQSRLLTTCHQPFALHNLNQKLTHYRKHRLSYNGQGEGEGEGEGPVDRVFRNQLPEFSPDVSYYSVKEYPQRDLALRCDVSQVLAVPVFEPSVQQRRCVGVLELLLCENFVPLLDYYFNLTHTTLKEAGLETIVTHELRTQIRKDIGHIEGKIWEALNQVRRTHGLPFASAWVRCAHSSSVDRGGSSNRSYNDSDVSCIGELVVSIPDMSVYAGPKPYYDYQTCSFLSLRVGESLIGKAFLFHKSYLCRDVTQLSIMEYPMAQFARNSKFTGCFAVCLRNIATRNHDYVLELFLPREEAYGGDLRNFLSLILATLKSHLKSFEAVSGELGNESFTEGYKVEGLFVEAYEGKGKNVICTEQSISTKSEGERTEPEDSTQCLRTAEHTLNSTCRKPVIYTEHSYKRSQVDCSLSKNVICTEQSNSDFTSYKTINISTKSEGERTETEDSTQSLRTAECTLKSTCRKPVIDTWPSYKRSKLDCSTSKIKHVTELDQVMPDMEMLTIKVIYGENILKFPLSSSTCMEDLVENVVTRLRMLKDIAFSIKYLDVSGETIVLSSDKDLQDCIDRSRCGAKDMIRMLIHLKENVQPPL